MRKYRAFLKERHEMRNVKRIEFEETYSFFGDVPSYVTVEGWCDIFPFDEIVLMQSTGLEDKNGVEIYEQDIAKGILRYGSKEFIGEVVWNGYNLTYDLVNDHDNKGYALSSLYELEVIGNIYENPELLEGE